MIDHDRNYCGLFSALAILFGLCGCADETVYPEPISPEKILKPVMIMAHRGGMAYAPENTVVGFKNGQRLEADILELDVQVQENEIFVLHDFTLGRTTDCGNQSSSVNASIRDSCDAGYRWLAGTNTFSKGVGVPYLRGMGIKIPLLEDVVDEVADSDARFMIELKHIDRGEGHPSIQQALDTLMTFVVVRSLESRVWINSSNPNALARIEAALPDVLTVLSWGAQIGKSCEESVVDAISVGADGVALEAARSGSASFGPCVRLAQNSGMMVIFWVVNRPKDVEQLLPFKPDVLLTDFPACLAALLRDVRIENPYPDEIPANSFLPKCG